MSSGIGVTYELDFVIKDDKAIRAIENMMKQAQKLADTLDKATMKKACDEAVKYKNIIKQTGNKVKELSKAQEAVGKNQIKNPFQEVKTGADGATKSVDRMINRIKRGFLYGVGSYLFQQAKQAFSQFSDIDFDIRAATAKTGGFGADYNDMFNLVNKIGQDTRFTNADVAKALNAGATLGIKKEELKQILPAASELAQAFNTEIPFAMEITKMHMNAYTLGQDKAIMVTDMLAATAKNSAADLQRLAEGFKYVGGKAKALDIPLEQVYAVIGKMNDSGFTGSTAGTAFRQFLNNLSDFKKRGKLEELIGPITDQKGNLLELSTILERIRDVTKNMGNADRASIMQTIFGIRGGTVMDTFFNQGVAGLRNLQEKIKESGGLTKKMSKYMMSGPAGAIEELLSTMESAFQSIFNSLSPLIVPVVLGLKAIGQAIIGINQKLPFLGQFVAILGSLVLGKGILVYILAKMPAFIASIKAAGMAFTNWQMLLVIGALMILFNLFERFTNYLSQNEEASKQWEMTLRQLEYALSNIGELISEFVIALFGLDEGQKDAKKTGDNFSDTMKIVSQRIFEFNMEVQKAIKWVKENKEEIRKWGKVFMILSGVVGILKLIAGAIGLINVVMATNPVVFIIMGIIAAITLLWFWISWLYNNVAWFRDAVNSVWSIIKDHMAMVIGQIIAGPIGMLIGYLIELYNTNDTFKNFCNEAWTVIKDTIKGACDFIISAIDGITLSIRNAIGAFKEFMNGNWEEAGKKAKAAFNGMNGFFEGRIQKNKENGRGRKDPLNLFKNATGTDYFQGSLTGGYTTTDEQGDEAIWLPNGSMIARNTTTRDILNNIKKINKNTQNMSNGGKVVHNTNYFSITSTTPQATANEIMNELEILGMG